MVDLFSGGICLPNMAPAIQSCILRRYLSGNLFPYSKELLFGEPCGHCCWTIMYTEIFFLSRSLLLVVLMHSMKDALNPLISEGFAVISPDKTLLVSPLFGLIPTLMYLAIGLYLRRIRKSKEQLQS